jgi:hypothetical protein
MIETSDIELFERYKDAPMYAFGSQNKDAYVTDSDKEKYWKIYEYIISASEQALNNIPVKDAFYVKAPNYSPQKGIRGHRPKSLWCAIRNKNSKIFNELPQIYVIVSERGIELGFAVSIPETDYSDINIKLKSRSVIPLIHKKLPTQGESLLRIDDLIQNNNNWYVNRGTRLKEGDLGFNEFNNASDLFKTLKSEGGVRGSGAICKIIKPTQIHDQGIDIQFEMEIVLNNFAELLSMCKPTEPDRIYIERQEEIEKYEEDFNISDLNQRKEYIFRSIQKRRGQKNFRNNLLDIYNSKCVISDCNIPEVLQAAHIFPYSGQDTNRLDNGLLLRADIHDLFDMFLISINPETLMVNIHPKLNDSEYAELKSKKINMPKSKIKSINKTALEWHFAEFKKTIE